MCRLFLKLQPYFALCAQTLPLIRFHAPNQSTNSKRIAFDASNCIYEPFSNKTISINATSSQQRTFISRKNLIPFSIVCTAVRIDTLRYDAIQYNTTQYSTIQSMYSIWHTMRHDVLDECGCTLARIIRINTLRHEKHSRFTDLIFEKETKEMLFAISAITFTKRENGKKIRGKGGHRQSERAEENYMIQRKILFQAQD